MHSIVKRLAVLGALGTTLGAVAPVAGASAAGIPVAPANLAAFPFPDFVPGPVANGQLLGSAVSGAVIITTAPTSFINTNNQTSAGGNVIGGQAGP